MITPQPFEIIYYDIALPVWLKEHDILCDQNGDTQVFCKDFSLPDFGNKETPLCCPLNTEHFIWDWHLANSKFNHISFVLGKIKHPFLKENVTILKYDTEEALQTVFNLDKVETETAKTVMLIYAVLYFHKQFNLMGYQYSLDQVRNIIKELPIFLIVKER